jgi:hypothetical protein
VSGGSSQLAIRARRRIEGTSPLRIPILC